LVAATAAGSPAAESGLRPNDLIVRVNGQPVGDSTLEQLLVRHGGGEVRLEVIRGSEQLELALTPEIR
jgi:serine protease DegS